MNYKMLLFVLGRILTAEAVLMLLPLAAAAYFGESLIPFLIPIILLLLLGLILTVHRPDDRGMRAKDSFSCVALSWILLSLFGSLPFIISGQIPSFFDAFFETVSGFTTTGSSILSNPEVLDNSLILWRSFTHWVGGMGILVFVLAIMPKGDTKNAKLMHLMRAESPGPSVDKVVPKIAETSRIMYGIYIVLTFILLGFLLVGKMPLFDALCHTFGTAGTGGFGIKVDSFASYSPYCQYVLASFMLIFGVNFNIYYLIIIGKVLRALFSEELRWYLIIVALAVGGITLSIYGFYNAPEAVGCTREEAFRMAYFQVASIISTSGFSTVNFDLWPSVSKAILLTVMLTGACAGCTAGGIKISRVVLLVKNGVREIKYILNPRTIKSVKFDGKSVDKEQLRGATSFFIVYMLIFVASTLAIIALEGCDLVTGFSSVATCLNNVGPGLSLVGPASHFGWMSDLSKLLLSFIMLAGRLEIFPILILFSPSTWKKLS